MTEVFYIANMKVCIFYGQRNPSFFFLLLLKVTGGKLCFLNGEKVADFGNWFLFGRFTFSLFILMLSLFRGWLHRSLGKSISISLWLNCCCPNNFFVIPVGTKVLILWHFQAKRANVWTFVQMGSRRAVFSSIQGLREYKTKNYWIQISAIVFGIFLH